VGSRYLVGTRLTALRRIAHLLPHDALALIITTGIVVVVLGWRMIVYLDRCNQRHHDTISRIVGQEGAYRKYEDNSSAYEQWPMEAVPVSEQTLRRTRPPQAGKTGHGDGVPLDRHQQVVSGTPAEDGIPDPAQGFPLGHQHPEPTGGGTVQDH
jgi:hypothetical protein